MKHVGGLVRYHRGEAGMTQEELAERAGVSPTTIVRLESEEIKRPRTETLVKLAEALGIASDTLVWFLPPDPNWDTAGPFTTVYQQDEGWWIGYVEELPGANAQERTLEEARESLVEAIRDVLEANRELTRTEFGDRDVVRETIRIPV
ncbi:MAG: helix-turn-helix domain-containing protein [Rubrobacter sp.]|jgi:transcriptional regulator with XRE-family HTH domain|nr:helix-turn-helix domain-containing protein [Rubrobacter sp.]